MCQVQRRQLLLLPMKWSTMSCVRSGRPTSMTRTRWPPEWRPRWSKRCWHPPSSQTPWTPSWCSWSSLGYRWTDSELSDRYRLECLWSKAKLLLKNLLFKSSSSYYWLKPLPKTLNILALSFWSCISFRYVCISCTSSLTFLLLSAFTSLPRR